MIQYEDEELEKQGMSCDGCIAVPVEIYIPSDGAEPVLTIYHGAKKAAKSIITKFGDCLDSAKAAEYIKRSIKPFAENIGIASENLHIVTVDEFVIRAVSDGVKELILDGCLEISSSDVYNMYRDVVSYGEVVYNFTGDPIDSVYIHTDGNDIVAIASVNDLDCNSSVCEICVETAPDYRRQGLASSCCAALISHLIDAGYAVAYKCRRENIESMRLQKRLGFTHSGTRVSCICYRTTASD